MNIVFQKLFTIAFFAATISTVSQKIYAMSPKSPEQEHKTVLPHTGVLHDMGSTITHKVQIVLKHVVEKKAPNIVARETNHSQRAVDHYIRDYYRVKTLHNDNKDVDYIHTTTNISKTVINQYLKIHQYVKERCY